MCVPPCLQTAVTSAVASVGEPAAALSPGSLPSTAAAISIANAAAAQVEPAALHCAALLQQAQKCPA